MLPTVVTTLFMRGPLGQERIVKGNRGQEGNILIDITEVRQCHDRSLRSRKKSERNVVLYHNSSSFLSPF